MNPGTESPPQFLGTAVGARAPFVEMVEQARLVEVLGYRTVWIPEISGRDAFVTAAVLASGTTTIRLGLGVVPLPSRSLSAIVMAAAAVAECAPDRFVLGLGAGHAETARSQFGWPGSATVDQVERAVAAVRRALRTGVLDQAVDGDTAVLQLVGQHVTTTPPVFIGALRPRMAEAAGRSADGMVLNWVTLERARTLAAAARALSPEAGFQVACYLPVCVVNDDAEKRAARRAVARQLSSYVQLRAYGELLALDGLADEVAAVKLARAEGRDAVAAVSDSLVHAVALIGDVEEVRAGLDEYRAAGVDEPVIAPVAIGDDSASSLMNTWVSLAPAA